MTITNSREIRVKRLKLFLSKRQRSILIGSLLGDGCLILNAWRKHCRFQASQTDLHKNYVFWLYREFNDWVLQTPKYYKITNSWRFRTISHPELTELFYRFYKHGKKVLPGGIMKLLTDPLSLAIWLMDDGCRMKNGSITFNTQCFSREENQLLQKCLMKNFGLRHTSIHRDKDKVRLYIKSRSLLSLQEIVKQYILPEFAYKLPIAP